MKNFHKIAKRRSEIMVSVTITLDAAVAAFYMQVARQADLPLDQVLSDALFKLAGEISIDALRKSAL